MRGRLFSFLACNPSSSSLSWFLPFSRAKGLERDFRYCVRKTSNRGFPREGRDTFEVDRLLKREIDIINIFMCIHIDQYIYIYTYSRYIYRSIHIDLQTKRLGERERESVKERESK